MKRPIHVESMIELAEEALDSGDLASAIRTCQQVLVEHPGHPGAGFLLAEAWRESNDSERAEKAYRDVLRGAPDHAPCWCALAALLFDGLRFDEAADCIQHAMQAAPDFGDAWFILGLLRERGDDLEGADRAFLRANHLEPEMFPVPVPLDDATVEAVVQDALMGLHPSLRAWMAEVPIVLEEIPDVETCRSFHPPMPPSQIVGCFSGPSVAQRSGATAWSALPPSIALYRRNLMRLATDRDRLVEEVRVTVLHEIGHYLGLDEADLEARGLD